MRINWIDNLKGIAILLIVLGHCYFPDKSLFISYVFSFHIVIFFFLSGVMFHDKKHTDFISFLKNKFHRLVIPYIWFNIIMFALLSLKNIFSNNGEFLSIYDFIRGLFFGSYLIIPDSGNYFFMPDGANITNVPTWFLLCLFVCSIFYFFLNKYIKNILGKVIFLLGISAIIFIESQLVYFRLPWSSEIALMSLLFYGLGHTFSHEITKTVEKIKLQHLIWVPILIGGHMLLLPDTNINFSSNYYSNNYFTFLSNAFLGTLTWIIIAKNIPENKILNFFGQNSLIVIGFEGIKFILLSIVIKLSFGWLVFEPGYLNASIQFFITIATLIPIIIFINRYCGWMIGVYKKK